MPPRAIIRAFLGLALALFPVLPAMAGNQQMPPAIDWQEQPMRLLMVEKEGCVYCLAWDRQIAPGYAASDEGRQAPLLRVDIAGPYPNGLALARRPFVTPTFILLRDGVEIDRIEGYAGREGFYPRLQAILGGTAD